MSWIKAYLKTLGYIGAAVLGVGSFGGCCWAILEIGHNLFGMTGALIGAALCIVVVLLLVSAWITTVNREEDKKYDNEPRY